MPKYKSSENKKVSNVLKMYSANNSGLWKIHFLFFKKGRTFQITKNAVATIQIITISAYCGFSYGLLFHKYMFFICFAVGHSRISRKLITFISVNVQLCINKHFLIPTFCSHYISFHPSIHTAPWTQQIFLCNAISRIRPNTVTNYFGFWLLT